MLKRSKSKARREERRREFQRRLRLFSVGLAGLVLLGIGCFDSMRAFNSRGWPTTEGAVFASQVALVNPVARRHHKRYHAAITYRYAADGKSQSATAYYPRRTLIGFLCHSVLDFSGPNGAQQTADRLPVGMKVTVAHHAADATRSQLRTPLDSVYTRVAVGESLLGLIIAVAGFGLLAKVKRESAQKPKRDDAPLLRVDED